MPSNSNYAFFWDPAGVAKYPAGYETGVERFFEDVAHDSGATSNVESVSAQYNDAAGQFASYSSHYAGAIVDTNPYPANGCKRATICLTDAQLQAELKRYVKVNGLPADLSHEYFLLTPPGVEDCFTAAGNECSAGSTVPVYCAYHGDVPLLGGAVIVYANDPYVTGNAGCDDGNHPNGSADGVIQGGLSHEHNESITDPEPNNAWTDFGGAGGEVGDKCRTFEAASEYGTSLGKAPDGASYNQLINGDFYWYQQEWSNQTHQCLQRLSFSGEEPTATFTSTAHAGTEVSFDASGSTAAGGVAHYNWQFNDSPSGEPTAPTETSAPTISHTFPAPGVYNVALTVFAADGTSVGTAQTVVVGTLPAPTVTKVSPAKGGAGTQVTITGTNLGAASAVTFGGVSASFLVQSATKILAEAPAHAPANVEVAVTSPGGTSAPSLGDHFKYVPTVTGVSPAGGPRAGGTAVSVTGSGFALGSTGTVFHFGTAKAPAVNCSSSTTCTVTTPAHEAGTVVVKATVNTFSSVKEAGDQYTFS